MPRPFTRRQHRQNARFLEALRRTGNARLAARLLGVHRSTYTKRRAKCPAFAAAWDAALSFAHARFHETGGVPPGALTPLRSSRAKALLSDAEGSRGACDGSLPALLDKVYPERPPQADGRRARDEQSRHPLRTKGGEPHIVRTRSGRLQLRRAPPGRMTKAAEQAFLRALSACANIRLAAAAAGFAHSSFYARARVSRAFAREKRLALAMGYDRVECAALAAALSSSHEDDAWRHNNPPPIPKMTADQALQLLFLHEKSVRQSWDQPHRRKRRGESWDTYSQRLAAMWTSEKAREAEEAAVAIAAMDAPEDDWHLDDAPPLPSLDQVTGWSKANPNRAKAVHNPDLALFGGWRLKEWEKHGRRK